MTTERDLGPGLHPRPGAGWERGVGLATPGTHEGAPVLLGTRKKPLTSPLVEGGEVEVARRSPLATQVTPRDRDPRARRARRRALPVGHLSPQPHTCWQLPWPRRRRRRRWPGWADSGVRKAPDCSDLRPLEPLGWAPGQRAGLGLLGGPARILKNLVPVSAPQGSQAGRSPIIRARTVTPLRSFSAPRLLVPKGTLCSPSPAAFCSCCSFRAKSC